MQKQKTIFSGSGNGISQGSLKESVLHESGLKGAEELNLWINSYAAKINQKDKRIKFLAMIVRGEQWFDLCDPKQYAKEEKGQVGAAISKNDGKAHLLKTNEEHREFRRNNRGSEYNYWVLEPIDDSGKKTVVEKLKEHPLYGEYTAVFPNKLL